MHSIRSGATWQGSSSIVIPPTGIWNTSWGASVPSDGSRVMSGTNFKDTGMPRLGKVGVAQGVAVGKSTQGRWRKVNELRFV